MRLVACRACHAQYDVTHVAEPVFDCRCGAAVRNESHAAVDARIQRCSACGALLPDGAEACEYCRSAVERDARRLSLICPECYARNRDSARFCAGCGVAFQPEPIPTEVEDPPACPVCAETLAPRAVGGVWVRECARCNGLWVPEDRLDRLVERAVDAARERAASGLGPTRRPAPVSIRRDFAYRDCPRCGHRMHRKNFGGRSGVIVDWCGAHGTWLDPDELEQIAAFIAAGGLREPGRAPGLSAGGRMSYEQAKALVRVENELGAERRRRERGGLLGEELPRGGLGAFVGLLERLLG